LFWRAQGNAAKAEGQVTAACSEPWNVTKPSADSTHEQGSTESSGEDMTQKKTVV